jgi:integrase
MVSLAGKLQALAFELMARESQGAHSGQLPENPIVENDVATCANPKGHDAMKVFGPYPHKKKWRIMIRLGSTQKAQSFGTEAEAKAEIRKLRIEAHKQSGISVEKAIEAYAEKLRTNGLRERSIETTCYRLLNFFATMHSAPLAKVTAAQARALYAKVPGSVDSRRNILAEAKTFVRKAKECSWTDLELLADVQGEGRRRFGKPKLTLDESRKFLAACIQLAASNEQGERTAGVACAMALLFGMRASEITGMQVRALDGNGTIIRITRAKTQAGIRSLQIPDWFQPYLARLAEGKASDEPLIGRNRTWLHRCVRATCKAAGVSMVSPHGLRGTHGDLALTAAVSPKAVSEALGHESLTTTYRHYADEGITQAAEHARVLGSLAPVSNPPLPN